MDQKAFQKKIRRFSVLGSILALGIAVYWVYQLAGMLFSFQVPTDLSVTVGQVLLLAAALAVIVLSLCLLHSIARGETPFTQRNVTRLRAIGWLLLAYEPLMAVFSWLSSRYMQALSQELPDGAGVTVTVHTSFGGLLMAVGLSVLCISTVFAYGCELQRQSDETL